MRLTIRFKIFLILLLVSTAVVAAMYGFMQWSFERGLAGFVETRQNARVERLVERLAGEFRNHPDWRRLRSDRGRWVEILLADRPAGSRVPRWARHRMPGPPDAWPPRRMGRHARSGEARYLPLELRVMLLDRDRSMIFGQRGRLDELQLHEISVAGRAVGYLGVLPGPVLSELGEFRFLERQTHAFVLVAGLMVLIAAGLSIPLAGALSRRLARITRASKALAAGRYDIRVADDSSDELGRLATDFNELAKALERTEHSRRQWVADISHELRTPLSTLRGELEALQDGVRALDDNAVDSLHEEIMHLNRLVDDLYQLSMSDMGALSYRKAKTDPVAILRDELDSFANEFRDRRIEVEITGVAPETLNANADPDRLSQLFRNLLSNVLRYTDEGGRLRVRVSRSQAELCFSFEDSAPGVAAPDLERLFDRFYRVDSSRSRASGGAGLGLAICRNIVEAHEGSIRAANSSLGGLLVEVALPITR